MQGLKGHQIIGELRLIMLLNPSVRTKLKGHQIIGELRHGDDYICEGGYTLKGHQIIGELRLYFPLSPKGFNY